jgi:hypothetical protein
MPFLLFDASTNKKMKRPLLVTKYIRRKKIRIAVPKIMGPYPRCADSRTVRISTIGPVVFLVICGQTFLLLTLQLYVYNTSAMKNAQLLFRMFCAGSAQGMKVEKRRQNQNMKQIHQKDGMLKNSLLGGQGAHRTENGRKLKA